MEDQWLELKHFPLSLQNIILAFNQLKEDVRIALLTQLGDAAQLQLHVEACEHLKNGITLHCALVPEATYTTMNDSLNAMIADLDEGKDQSADEPDMAPIEVMSTVHTHQRGGPQIEINPDILATALQFAGPTRLGAIFGIAPHTMRRRALEHEIVEPGNPVYVEFTDDEGETLRYYTSSTAAQSSLPNDELDAIMLQILTQYLHFRCYMIDGQLRHIGVIVPRSRIQASYARIHGPPVAAFGVRCITRQVYNVKGYNSLTHHDGQHEEILPDDEAIAEYGIDWNDIENHHIHAHHHTANQLIHNPLGNNPFVAYMPETLNNVQVDEPNCPLTWEQLVYLQEVVAQLVDDGTNFARWHIWEIALALYIELLTTT
ncbi:hypothetical protein BDR05DRAFT_998427 [Suillus weaverae]|nr:hypothetical protein BDR05DRAFT_998427 [Suillus weaverae]